MPWKDPEKRRACQAKYREQHREEARLRTKEWRDADPERARASERRWREANADKWAAYRRDYHKRWYQENKEKKDAQSRDWYKAHPEKKRQHVAAYRARNPELSRERVRQYFRDHPEVRKNHSRARRALERGATVAGPIDAEKIYGRDGYRCHICDKKVARPDLSLDHLIPLSRGGMHTVENVRTAHKRCNSSRGAGRKPAQLLLIG